MVNEKIHRIAAQNKESKYDQTPVVSSKIGKGQTGAPASRTLDRITHKISKYMTYSISNIFNQTLRIFTVAGFVAVWLLYGMVGECIADRSPLGRQVKTIVLDPGHGGDDHGAKGPGGTLEKRVNLALAGTIASTCGDKYNIVLTRHKDNRLDLPDRTAVANHHRADLFISLHTGGSFRHSTEGMHVYYFEEPKGSMPEYPLDTDRPVPWDRLQDRHGSDGRKLAFQVHRALKERINPAMDQIQGLPLAVLRGAAMPAILVEIGTITNPSEERALKSAAFLSATAEAICAGIGNYFE